MCCITTWIGYPSCQSFMRCMLCKFVSVFKLCCLGVSSALSISPDFSVTLPDLASEKSNFTSAVRSVQSSLTGIINVFWIFLTPRTVALFFALLGKGRSLLEDPNYSVGILVQAVYLVVSVCRIRLNPATLVR